MNDVKPGLWVSLGGAVVMLIGTFLPWFSLGPFDENGLSSDFFGMMGIFVLIMALGVGVIVSLRAFAPQANMPDQVIGYTPTQLVMVLGVASFLSTVGLAFRSNTGIGIWISALGAAAIVTGSILEARESAAPPPPGAPGGGQPNTF